MTTLNTAINTTFIGFSIVFIALILLSIIIYVFSKIIQHKKVENVIVKNSVDEAQSQEEIVAVLTAAVTAISKRTPDTNFKIQSFRRIQQKTPIWNKVSRSEYLSNKL